MWYYSMVIYNGVHLLQDLMDYYNAVEDIIMDVVRMLPNDAYFFGQ